MKKIVLFLSLVIAFTFSSFGQGKKDIVKTGYNLGPLPVIAFDADKGLQYGALVNLYDFGDGSEYPNPRQQWYAEASFFTKGSQLYTLTYDSKYLIPGVRFSTGITVKNERALDFYGFNGYCSYFDYQAVQDGKDGKSFQYTPYYRTDRIDLLAKLDFTGTIIPGKFYWEAGYYFSYIKQGAINLDKINKGKSDEQKFPEGMTTLYEQYRDWGIIPESEANGGINSIIRLGLLYDTRDVENSPSKGIWAEGHTMLAPKFLGTTNPYYRYSLSFRHYVPIIYKKLTLAYRLNYQGTIGKSAPYYVLPYYSVFGVSYDKDGIGGYRTVRGMMRNRVQGLDVGFYNLELRWKFIQFQAFKQNIAFALSAFNDGAVTTREYDMSFRGAAAHRASYDSYMAKGMEKDKFHLTAGAGLRFIMNENFIVAFEYGKSFNKQDGNGAFYINIGYLF